MEYKEYGIARRYAEQLATQMRKGLLSYLVLTVAEQPIYASDIIRRLSEAGLTVVEGTIYPLLLRLQRDGLLQYEWREDGSSRPPRKYYSTTELGRTVLIELRREIKNLNQTTRKLERKETK
ncbi:PadR family transcriptional regulator [Candidatus Saccharibacteria bacterium]|nr:PadR family transcriptional regulator [Candidatus Saccharibacteria bacterium]